MSKHLSILFLCFIIFVHCNTSITQKKHRSVNPEGYVFLSFTYFNDIDARGIPINAADENDLLTGNRRMYIYKDFLIDIIGSQQYVDGKYVKTDTTSYEFYDLDNQNFAFFDKLSTDAKILKKGKMSESGSFSNLPEFDPMNEIHDSMWKVTDTIINGTSIGVINFINTDPGDTLSTEYIKRTKLWVDYGQKNLPLQLSYTLSRKLNGAFIYKRQTPAPDGKGVLVTAFNYKPVKLPDTLVQVFNKWARIVRE